MTKKEMDRVIPRAGLAVMVFALGVSVYTSSAHADPTNYQRYVIGERALGMGGAQTAAVDDPMANLYNPAAMVFTTSTMVSASKSLYSLDSRKIKGGFVPRAALNLLAEPADAQNLEQKNDLSLPSTLALSSSFGPRLGKKGPPRHAMGIAILVPNQDSFTLRASWSGENLAGYQDKETYSLGEANTQVWMGISYAFRVLKEFGLGLSVFLVKSDYDRDMTRTRFSDLGEYGEYGNHYGFMEFAESHLSIDTISLLFRLGALLEPHKNWRLGLVVSSPTILLGDLKLFKTQGSLKQTYGLSNFDGTESGNIEYYNDSYKLKVMSREPMAIRAGIAFVKKPVFAIDLDVNMHLPVKYDLIKGDPVQKRRYPKGLGGPENEEAANQWFDDAIVRKIEREFVANLNIGWELIIDDMWTVRNGFFTDFSSAPSVKTSGNSMLTHVDHYGASVSGGFKAKGYDISIGVMGAFGNGTASVYDVNRDIWQPAQVEERALYIFIAGIQSAVTKSTKKLAKKTIDKVQDALDDGDEEEDGEDEEESDDVVEEATWAS